VHTSAQWRDSGSENFRHSLAHLSQIEAQRSASCLASGRFLISNRCKCLQEKAQSCNRRICLILRCTSCRCQRVWASCSQVRAHCSAVRANSVRRGIMIPPFPLLMSLIKLFVMNTKGYGRFSHVQGFIAMACCPVTDETVSFVKNRAYIEERIRGVKRGIL
jgi:hypothetical protein